MLFSFFCSFSGFLLSFEPLLKVSFGSRVILLLTVFHDSIRAALFYSIYFLLKEPNFFLFVLLVISSDTSSVRGWIRRKAGKITAKAVAVSVLLHRLIIKFMWLLLTEIRH